MARMRRRLEVDGVVIADDSPCYVVAEIGHNHQGDVEQAKRLIASAKEWGVDAVKLQKRSNRTLYTRAFYERPYDNEFSFGRTYGEHREALELGANEYRVLIAYARELGITLFATAFDVESADLLADLGVPAFKLASGDLRNTPLQRHVASFGKPIFLSTGGGTIEDVDRAVETILPLNDRLCVLQCTAAYPAQAEDLNLNVIPALRDRYPELVIGLSDHQNGIAMAVVAYMLGARVIEKHFTLDHALKGTDHAFSLMPDGMRRLVRDLRRIPAALGDGVKRPLPVEAKPLEKMGKKLVAARDLDQGRVLTAEDVAIKSPADGGLPPYELDRLVGRRLRRRVASEDVVTFDDVEAAERPVRVSGPVEGVRGNREVPPGSEGETSGASAERPVRASGPVEGVRGNREVPPGSEGEASGAAAERPVRVSGPVEGVRGNREVPPVGSHTTTDP
jgi:sialic acid synthase